MYVEGQPEIRTYTKNDGSFGASLVLRVFSVQLLGSRSGENAGGGSDQYNAPASSGVPASSDVNEPVDDLPF